MEVPRAALTPLYVVCLRHVVVLRRHLSIPYPPHAIMRPEGTPVLNSPFPSLQYGSGIGDAPSATHDTSRVSYHVKHLDTFTQTLQEVSSSLPSCCSASRQVNLHGRLGWI